MVDLFYRWTPARCDQEKSCPQHLPSNVRIAVSGENWRILACLVKRSLARRAGMYFLFLCLECRRRHFRLGLFHLLKLRCLQRRHPSLGQRRGPCLPDRTHFPPQRPARGRFQTLCSNPVVRVHSRRIQLRIQFHLCRRPLADQVVFKELFLILRCRQP